MRIALTGATGFVGGHALRLALDAGHDVTALTRRKQPERAGVTWVQGDLNDQTALRRLCEQCEAVLHIAGVVNAPDRQGFIDGNVTGTQNIITVAKMAGISRFVHTSSLSAREPDLSDYGWSKYQAEQCVEASALEWTIVRPPAVYGPGDQEMRDMFRMAKTGFITLPPKGRLSIIHGEDLARLLLILTTSSSAVNHILEPDDGVIGGWSHEAFARAIGTAMGRNITPLSLPRWILQVGAHADRLIRGNKAKLSLDRVRYFCHPDWVISPQASPDPSIWSAMIPTEQGLKDTADWYHRHRLL